MNVAALIPAFKPGPALIDTLEGLKRRGFDRIVVIDDGSGPDHAEIFAQAAALGAVVLRHAVNMGKGAALKTGLNAICAEAQVAGIVTVDADGQHLPADVAKVAASFLEQPGDLVLGARRFERAPLRSRLGNELTRLLFRVAHGQALLDTQTGLRAFNLDFARATLEIPSKRYEFELDMLILARKTDVPIRSVPIATVYIDNNASSHFNPLVDSVKIYFSLFRFSLAGLTAAIIDNTLFWLLFSAGAPILLSQACGRTVASMANYAMLKRLVFHSDERDRIAAPKYVASVVVFGLMSYGLIIASKDVLGIAVVPAKIAIEIAIFLANYALQRVLVFKERER